MSKRAEMRRASAAAAKQRRQKMVAFGGLGVLAVLLLFQGPRILDEFGGSSNPAPVALPVSTLVPPDGTTAPGRKLRFKGRGSDPFSSRSLANNDPRAGAVSGPVGAKDPFVKGGSSAAISSPSTTPDPVAKPLPKRIVVGTPTPGAIARRGWIVVLASIQTRVGRGYANRFAAGVRRDGLGAIAVLDSSTRRPLRKGYYVVYTGPFETLSEVQRSAAHVRAFGYRTAYVREILRY